MDLDAILARRPTVCLVDELAHTNAPGSRHPKRYQDVEELLRAGINVITTLNIQHLESLYDVVERATGVKVKERLPDYVLGRGRPDRQRRRLGRGPARAAEGRQGLSAGAGRAGAGELLHGPNLTRLREIALTEIAHLIDRRSRRAEADQAPASATERVMVGLSSRSPNAPALLRKAARLADRLNAPWYAVYIQTPTEDLTRIDAATQRLLDKNLELAQQLGGMPMTFKGRDVASTMLGLRPRVRHQGHRHGQDPPALAPPVWSAARSWSGCSGGRRARPHGRGCLTRRLPLPPDPGRARRRPARHRFQNLLLAALSSPPCQ